MIRAGVIGHPIGHSLSPRIHNQWFEDVGIEGQYEAVDASPQAFEATVHELMDEGWAGLNVTIPHKAAARELAGETSAAADLIGAANLLIFRDGDIVADNTDVFGFEMSLEAIGVSRSPEHAVVLGAGGAAGAVLYALRGAGRVTLLNRTRERAEAVADRFSHIEVRDWADRDAAAAEAPDLLVNTTSLGMEGQPPLDLHFGNDVPRAAVDIVYGKGPTPFLKLAKSGGVEKLTDGLAMLVYQAAPSFEAWTSCFPDADRTLSELRASL
ncbi:MAG: shikimate dehydrogenase [Pseudomonadota bacterium]